MKHYKPETKPQEKLTHITCDLCKAVSTAGYSRWTEEPISLETMKTMAPFSGAEVVVQCDLSWSCEDFGDIHHYDYDLCPKCFFEKIVPLFPEVKPRKSEW